MEHKHEPLILLGGSIKCRTCGEPLLSMEEKIAITDSVVKANKILQAFAVDGKYQATSFSDGFVIYTRERNGNHEEVIAQKLSNRKYRVYKTIVRVGGDG